MSAKLRVVSATRLSREDFWGKSLLGRSLMRFPDRLLPELSIQFDNREPTAPSPNDANTITVRSTGAEGLSSFYNRIIEATEPSTNLLFVHDDVFIHDIFLQERLIEAFRRFDIVGLAGSFESDPEQPSWALAFDPDTLEPIGWQKDVQLSGAVSHLPTALVEGALDAPPDPLVSLYGPTPAPCTLLDGLFLAVRTAAIGRGVAEKRPDVRFDQRFDFHLYDIDFCRSAHLAGLALGTWPILVTHASGGAFGSEAFKQAARAYLAKWNVKRFERELGFDTASLLSPTPTTPTL